MNQQNEAGWIAAKVASAWAAVGVATWNDAAGFAAFCYTMWLIAEKLWKTLLKPFAISRGWLPQDEA